MAVTIHTVRLTGSVNRRQTCDGCLKSYVYTMKRTATAEYSTGGLTLKSTQLQREHEARKAVEAKLAAILADHHSRDATRCPYCQRINEPHLLSGQIVSKSTTASFLLVAGLVSLGMGLCVAILSTVLAGNVRQALLGIMLSAPLPLILGVVLLKYRGRKIRKDCERIHSGGASPAVQAGRRLTD